jgi:tetratricopeptide (TPR) repeat protein
MGQRRILVIGSQCHRLPELGFLPQVAADFYAVMTDPALGACIPALDGSGLIIDPTVAQARQLIESAFMRAAADRATLFIAYIGHGEMLDEDFYLLPTDSVEPVSSQNAVQLTTHIKELARTAAGRIDGLAVLIDACYSGVAASTAATAWIAGLKGSLRFEILTAASNRPAADGCFMRSVTNLVSQGLETVPTPHVYFRDLRSRVALMCSHQVPQHPSYNADDTLWLSKNRVAPTLPWAKSSFADHIQRLTQHYQPTTTLVQIAAAFEVTRNVAVLGPPGAGKSTLAAALASPNVTANQVVAGFVHAIVMINESMSPHEIAATLGLQLAVSVPHFSEKQRDFKNTLPAEAWRKLNALERDIIGPLKRANPDRVRLVFDSLDRLSPAAAEPVMGALDALSRLDFVRLLVTARPDTPVPTAASPVHLADPNEEELRSYLASRGIPTAKHGEILATSQNNWLVTRVLADLIEEDGDVSREIIGLSLGDIYEEMLLKCAALDDPEARSVLAILAAAGAGPIIPLELVVTASQTMGGPGLSATVRDHVVRLKGLSVRSLPGTEDERLGLFHQTLADYIQETDPAAFLDANKAIIRAIGLRAPGDSAHALHDPYYAYAFSREAEHYWAIGQLEETISSLRRRLSEVPKENLYRAKYWEAKFEKRLGADHRYTLETRSNVAFETGAAGDANGALELYKKLLQDIERVFGKGCIESLAPRHNIAWMLWQSGERVQSRQMMTEVLADRQRLLGQSHPDTMTSRNVLASWNVDSSGHQASTEEFKRLLQERTRTLGPLHPDTLTVRNNLLYVLVTRGDPAVALREGNALLPIIVNVFGDRHPHTLKCEGLVAWAKLNNADLRGALAQFRSVASKQTDVLGPAHPDVLKSQSAIAGILARLEQHAESEALMQAVVAQGSATYAIDHPEYWQLRRAELEALSWYRPDEARTRAVRLLTEIQKILGAEHVETLSVRFLQCMLLTNVDIKHAQSLALAISRDCDKSLGPSHPLSQQVKQLIAALQHVRS